MARQARNGALAVGPGVALLRELGLGGAGDLLHEPLDVLRVRRRLEKVKGVVFSTVKHAIYVDDVKV